MWIVANKYVDQVVFGSTESPTTSNQLVSDAYRRTFDTPFGQQ
jgi:hypothetical protein